MLILIAFALSFVVLPPAGLVPSHPLRVGSLEFMNRPDSTMYLDQGTIQLSCALKMVLSLPKVPKSEGTICLD